MEPSDYNRIMLAMCSAEFPVALNMEGTLRKDTFASYNYFKKKFSSLFAQDNSKINNVAIWSRQQP